MSVSCTQLLLLRTHQYETIPLLWGNAKSHFLQCGAVQVRFFIASDPKNHKPRKMFNTSPRDGSFTEFCFAMKEPTSHDQKPTRNKVWSGPCQGTWTPTGIWVVSSEFSIKQIFWETLYYVYLKSTFPCLWGRFNTCCYSKIANLSWPRVRRAGYLPKSFFKASNELCQRALNPVVCDTVTKDFLTMS